MRKENCPICGSNVISRSYNIKDMMYINRKASYKYNECNSCFCLYIDKGSVQNNLYENAQYYSFNLVFKEHNGILDWFKKKRFSAEILRSRNIFSFLNKFKRLKSYNLNWLKQLNVNDLHIKILDVGCGAGSLLMELKNYGFTNLTGIDPFLNEDLFYKNVTIRKMELFDVDQQFDVIMFHHVLEHLDNPQEILYKAKKLLTSTGKIVIRIPYKDSFAWNNFKENWVQLDAPRHQVIYSQKSLMYLVNEVGLKVESMIFDSTSFQFIGSEQYRKGICLTEENSYYSNVKTSIFDAATIDKWEQVAKSLNYINYGDQISIVLSL